MTRSFIMNRIILLTTAALAVWIAGCKSSKSDDMNASGAGSMPQAQNVSGATDLHNTVCPVTGDAVGDSKLTEAYNGKVYHFCCDDCPDKFKATPDKYANAVAANPAKYGVK
jgi:YHS domain-containing protein